MYSVAVEYKHDNRPHTGSCTTGGSTLEEALQKGIEYAIFIMGTKCRSVEIKDVVKTCEKCSGSGRIVSRKNKIIGEACKKCNGTGHEDVIIKSIKINKPESTDITNQ